ncbi:HGGxSTG domain-containing protein [Methylobacterium sp. ID0610]|uniref:HGGxSTG domain-containing protein n=1 Tax=Methylobacterium carpenticola TaxID=3344827 RepID=UPI00367BD670
METEGNPMRSKFAMHLSPRCGARTRSGRPCGGPAMPNGRCRMHGGQSPGAPKGQANGMYRHGRHTNEALAQRRELNTWVRMLRRTAREIG